MATKSRTSSRFTTDNQLSLFSDTTDEELADNLDSLEEIVGGLRLRQLPK